jgi:hypothetical protein
MLTWAKGVGMKKKEEKRLRYGWLTIILAAALQD